jgi:hypothetical protein
MLALPLVLSACRSAGSNTDAPAAPVPVPFATVVQIAVPGQTGQRVQEVVRDADAWKKLWAELRKDSVLAEDPPAPAVDFEHEMVVVAAMETQGCVSRVTIRSITRTNDKAAVDVLEEPPAANLRCFASSRPIHVVRVQRMSGEVTFTTATREMGGS